MEYKQYFKLEQLAAYPGLYQIVMDYDLFPPMRTEGVYQVFPARLLSLSWANYLRFCRDVLNAVIIGHAIYPIIAFRKNNITRQYLKYLNTLTEFIMIERAHPYDLYRDEDGKVVREEWENNLKN